MLARYPFYLVLLTAAMLSGCLGDPIGGPEIKPRLVLRPEQAWLQAITDTKNIRARWTPSKTDTQQNFKGYLVLLYKSAPYIPVASDGEDSVFEPPLDSVHVPKSDTSYVFSGEVAQNNRYSVHVWGEQNHDPAKDTIILSSDYADATLVFDADPVHAPTTIFAGSGSVQSVNLQWGVSPDTAHLGFAGYIIRYRDNTSSKSKINETRIAKTINFTSVPIAVTSGSSFLTPYLFWVKSVRNDSTESTDSTMIEWSGAWIVPQVGDVGREVHPGKKIFIGQTNSFYDLLETDAAEAQIGVDTAGGQLVLTGLNNAKFTARYDEVTSLDSLVYDKPIDEADFTQTSLQLPLTIPDTANVYSGFVVYVLFNEKTRVRLRFFPDGTVRRSLIWPNGVVKVYGRFQSYAPNSLKYF